MGQVALPLWGKRGVYDVAPAAEREEEVVKDVQRLKGWVDVWTGRHNDDGGGDGDGSNDEGEEE